ncbi:MAG TPA: glutamate-1-semialdehyde 2,1-aminomutase [Bacteroidota bacterium]|nr:glutamate-1-semialdehyde 2,1-aminomutase [Bacteroidota bacterium]
MNTTRSEELFTRAQEKIPGGVNSPVRAFKSVGRSPIFIKRAEGARLWDEDGNSYIDYVGSWGPMILGHTHPVVTEAISKALADGTSFGAATLREVEMAELITQMVPSMEMVRMVNSGTEATMSAVRLARAYTKRSKIIKFEGCYHGHADSFLISAGSGAMTLGIPDSPGVTESIAADTLTAHFNDLQSVKKLIDAHRDQIAALIVEPVVGNMGCVVPAPGFLQGLRTMATEHGIVLILDEVMTGFRVAPGGAQQLYKIDPDLTTLGKIIGGGLPVGAYGGKKELMKLIAPSGPVYQAGTLSGNPLAMAAGLAALRILNSTPDIYVMLEERSKQLADGMKTIIDRHKLPLTQNRVGSMFTLFFSGEAVTDYAFAKKADTKRFGRYYNLMLEKGVYLAPSQFEAAFISMAHTRADIEHTLAAAEESLCAVFSV